MCIVLWSWTPAITFLPPRNEDSNGQCFISATGVSYHCITNSKRKCVHITVKTRVPEKHMCPAHTLIPAITFIHVDYAATKITHLEEEFLFPS